MNVPLARTLRRRSTDAERMLWRRLRHRQLSGEKFRRQVIIGSYIVDFACMPAKLIVEVDGSQHAKELHQSQDEKRTRWLESQGYTVLRFWNSEVLGNTDGVVLRILETLERRVTPTPTLPHQGGGL